MIEIQSYRYLALNRNFCPNCGTQLTITVAEPNPKTPAIMALNVRAFQGIDYDKIKIQYVSMKDEEPMYDPETISAS